MENPLLIPNGAKERTINTHKEHMKKFLPILHDPDLNKQVTTLLFGDSLLEHLDTTLTNNDTVFNASVSGDGIQHLLWRYKNGYSENINNLVNLKKIIILICTNNTEKNNYAKLIYNAIINFINIVNTDTNNSKEIIVLAIPPRNSVTNKIKNNKIVKNNVIQCNELLSKINIPNVQFHNITNDFEDDQGNLINEYYVDCVHFSDLAYQIFFERLQKLFKK